jgi:hypothetical protein
MSAAFATRRAWQFVKASRLRFSGGKIFAGWRAIGAEAG